jgi:hypothetical protein
MEAKEGKERRRKMNTESTEELRCTEEDFR